jgi:8-oxo-dGTP pyrophosphatase MutT (NUDIX family)
MKEGLTSVMVDYDRLVARYEGQCQVVRRRGRVFPAAVVTGFTSGLESGQWHVQTASVRPDSDLAHAGAPHLAAVRAAAPSIFDGAVAAFAGWRPDGRLVVGPGSYFEMIATCDALRAEFQCAGPGTALVLREEVERIAGGRPLEAVGGRVAAVGVSVAVTILGKGGGRQVLMGRRSNTVALDAGQVHLVPSGMTELHQKPVETAQREFTEELGVSLPNDAQLIELGIGWDLLRLRPEICFWLDLPGTDDLVSSVTEGGGNGEFGYRWLADVGGTNWDKMWEVLPPEAVTPAATATLALLECILE